MKSFTFSFLLNISLIFILFSFALYLLGISPFLFPHIPIYTTLLAFEKSRKVRLTTAICTLIIFSFLSTPLPLPFLILLSTQLYIYTRLSFSVTTFDMPVIALMTAIFSSIIININLATIYFVTTASVPIGELMLNLAVSNGLLLFLFITLKERINRLFLRDYWL